MKTPENDHSLSTTMSTLSEVLNTLKRRGYETEFIFSDKDGMQGFDQKYLPIDLTLIRTYRFEGMSDPEDNAALYLLEDKSGNIGYIIDSYGNQSNYGTRFSEFLKRVPIDNKMVEHGFNSF